MKKDQLLIPGAIIIAGLLVALAVYAPKSSAPADQLASAENQQRAQQMEEEPLDFEALTPVTDNDHVRGSRDAKITIVEYSDFECPYCQRFHSVMQQVTENYDANDVAWVYRHFPIDSLHSKARIEAVASECAAELGGREAFWQFADSFFAQSPANDRTDIETLLPSIAQEIGIDVDEFSTCIEEERTMYKVEEDLENAIATGGRGTPWNIVVTSDGEMYPLKGALPYAQLSQILDALLEE